MVSFQIIYPLALYRQTIQQQIIKYMFIYVYFDLYNKLSADFQIANYIRTLVHCTRTESFGSDKIQPKNERELDNEIGKRSQISAISRHSLFQQKRKKPQRKEKRENVCLRCQ